MSQNEQLGQFSQLCRELGETESVVATAWVLHQTAVASAIVGVRTLGHLDGVDRAAALKPDADALKRLDEIFPINMAASSAQARRPRSRGDVDSQSFVVGNPATEVAATVVKPACAGFFKHCDSRRRPTWQWWATWSPGLQGCRQLRRVRCSGASNSPAEYRIPRPRRALRVFDAPAGACCKQGGIR